MSELLPSGGVMVPRSLLWAAILAIPTVLVSGTTFVVLEQTAVSRLEERAIQAERKLTEFSAKLDTIASVAESNKATASDATNKIDLRLTRIEAQLVFIAAALPKGR